MVRVSAFKDTHFKYAQNAGMKGSIEGPRNYSAIDISFNEVMEKAWKHCTLSSSLTTTGCSSELLTQLKPFPQALQSILRPTQK